jgi:hypothetical protein
MSTKFIFHDTVIFSGDTQFGNHCVKGRLFKAICKMGSKFVTLGSKVIFLGGNIFIFLTSKITFLAAKVGSRNYFYGQQELFFWAARIHILSCKYFSYRNSKFWFI